MNSRPPSRFVRGRGRGGGAYRPYFYFRRNGRTIPARGNHEPASGKVRGRGRNRGQNPAPINSSFLRPENYAAPEDGLQIQSISADNPPQCPGWRLYFVKDSFDESNELAKRIKILEQHYLKYPKIYKLQKIKRKCYFTLRAEVVTADQTIADAWPQLLQDFRAQPVRTLATFGVAMHSVVSVAAIDAALSLPLCSSTKYVPRNTRLRKIYTRPEGFMDVGLISNISRKQLDNAFCVRGSVSAVGSVEAAATWIAYSCARCRHEQALRQTGYHPSRPHNCKSSNCHAKNNFIEQRSSPYTRITPKQIIRLAETHLQANPNLGEESVESLDIELRHDLVDSAVVGQDVIITGILKMRPLDEDQDINQANKSFSAATSNDIEVCMKGISVVSAETRGHLFTARDDEAIARINAEPDSFKLLVHSLAPELHGHYMAKAGVLLSLFGGAGSQLHNDGEINVLLVGDPGIGKSHLLQMCAEVSEKGSLISGKRGGGPASGAKQLSVTVQGRSNYAINAGAVISARNGHCSIDDIYRMASQQETLSQVMQSKIITLPFPGVFATITTPTAIIAAANSLRGHYDQAKSLNENIRINPALLKQFHLTFVLLDRPNRDLDNSFTEHIRDLHAGIKQRSTIAARFALKPKLNKSTNQSVHDEDENDDNYDLAERLKLSDLEAVEMDLLPPILTKKFIAYARQHVNPMLTEKAAEALKDFYMEIRDDTCSSFDTSQLEGLIRLTQARARIDFSAEANKLHLRDVQCIVRDSIANTSLSSCADINPAGMPTSSQSSMVKKFIHMLQQRSNALARRIFDFDELKDMARHAGISCGVTNIVEIVNLQGFLLKKGPNLYEVMEF